MRARALDIVRDGFERENNHGVSVHDLGKLDDMSPNAMLDFVEIMVVAELTMQFTRHADGRNIDDAHPHEFAKELRYNTPQNWHPILGWIQVCQFAASE